ncbi:hypothetical protein ACFQ2M_19050 [Kitasatospora saccharophila]|uniref:hypothetical protein n=1 Tax=Kitasatospora saccharophila TaxID=407973 RepID=UPI0036458982
MNMAEDMNGVRGMTATLEGPGTTAVPLRRNRRFQTLWAGSAAAMLGTCVADTAYPLLLLAMTGSPTVAGPSAPSSSGPRCCSACTAARSPTGTTGAGS